jgi:hypothetical protein
VFKAGALLTPVNDYAEAVNQITLTQPATAGQIVQLWVESVPTVALTWKTVKLDTSVWTTTGGPIHDANGNPINPAAASDILVSVDGVWQNPTVDYIVSSGTITFINPLPADAHTFGIAIIPIQTPPAGQTTGATTLLDTSHWTFDGTTTNFTMISAATGQPVDPQSAVNVLVSLNGVWQAALSDYTTAGSVLTFATPPGPDDTVFAVDGLPAFTS